MASVRLGEISLEQILFPISHIFVFINSRISMKRDSGVSGGSKRPFYLFTQI